MPRYTIEAPDGRRITVEADDDRTAMSGAQDWVSKNPAKMPEVQKAETDVAGETGFGDRFRRFSDLVMDPFHLSDEIRGGGAAVRGLVTSGGSFDEAGKAYTEASEKARAERRVASEANNPIVAGYQVPLWELAGGFATTGPTAGLTSNPGFWRTAGKSAAVGGGYGATAGFTSGEGGLENRLLGALEGGAAGATLGPLLSNVAIPVVARTAGAVQDAFRYGNKAVRSALHPEQAAVENVADRMVDSGLDPAAARAAVTPPPSTNLSKRGFTEADMADVISRQMKGESADSVAKSYSHLVDAKGRAPTGATMRGYLQSYQVDNPTPMNIIDIAKEIQGEGGSQPLWRLGRSANSLAGDEAKDAAQRLMNRQEDQSGRVSGIIRQSVGDKDFEDVLEKGIQNLKTEAGKAYEGFNAEPDLAIDKLGELMDDPLFREAMGNAQKQARVEVMKENIKRRRQGQAEEPIPFTKKNDPEILGLRQELEDTKDALVQARRRRQDATSREEKRAALEESREHEDTITAITRQIKELTEANVEVLSPQTLDYLQRQLRLKSQGFASDPNAAAHARNLREVFLDRIEDFYPSFKPIRTQYAQMKGEFGEEGALQAGRDLTNRLGDKTDDALREFASMTPAQKELFRLGFARNLLDMAADPQIGGAVANKFNTPATREIIKRLYKGDRALEKRGSDLIRNLRREAITTKTKNDVLSGARTAELESDMGRMMEGAKTAADVATGRIGAVLSNLATRLSTQMGRRGASETLKILTETDPAELLPLLNRLAKAAASTAERRQYVTAIRELRALRSPLLSGVVGQESGRQLSNR